MGDNQEQEGAFTNLSAADNSRHLFVVQMPKNYVKIMGELIYI
jgi:hypothetical protein